MNLFKRILSDILFGIGVLWQVFVMFGVFWSEKTLQDYAIGALLTLLTVGVLYISLKIRPPYPGEQRQEKGASSARQKPERALRYRRKREKKRAA